MKTLAILTSIIIFLTYSCVTKPKKTFYSGNNAYCAPALIIESPKDIEQKEIETIIKNTYTENNLLGNLRCIVYKNNNAELYIKADKINETDKEIKFTYIPFKTILKELNPRIKEFYEKKSKSPLHDHSIYAIYFSLGTCAFVDYDPNISIISISSKNEYYYTKINKTFDSVFIEPIKLEQKDTSFSFTHEYYGNKKAYTYRMYNVEHKNLVFKSSEYVSESDKKYLYYLFKIPN